MKTETTINIEKALYKYTGANSFGVYGCFECTIGEGYGDERIDFITMDTESRFRCYEIKVSKSDLFSKNKLSFVGDYNYFVMPEELYEEIKDDDRFSKYLWQGIGVITYTKEKELPGHLKSQRAAKKKHVSMAARVSLMFGMVRSLSRYCHITPEEEMKTLKKT